MGRKKERKPVYIELPGWPALTLRRRLLQIKQVPQVKSLVYFGYIPFHLLLPQPMAKTA